MNRRAAGVAAWLLTVSMNALSFGRSCRGRFMESMFALLPRAILLAGGVAFTAVPSGYIVGGVIVLQDPLDLVANVLLLIRQPRSSAP